MRSPGRGEALGIFFGPFLASLLVRLFMLSPGRGIALGIFLWTVPNLGAVMVSFFIFFLHFSFPLYFLFCVIAVSLSLLLPALPLVTGVYHAGDYTSSRTDRATTVGFLAYQGNVKQLTEHPVIIHSLDRLIRRPIRANPRS